jgi:hypothetical protein
MNAIPSGLRELEARAWLQLRYSSVGVEAEASFSEAMLLLQSMPLGFQISHSLPPPHRSNHHPNRLQE